ncbi:MAG: hypothetical protein D6765_03405 [Bacteroidetes bacterium]|nr:MAG: hypothetical protein D6765_03405 [Bacteroidota bacterium]
MLFFLSLLFFTMLNPSFGQRPTKFNIKFKDGQEKSGYLLQLDSSSMVLAATRFDDAPLFQAQPEEILSIELKQSSKAEKGFLIGSAVGLGTSMLLFIGSESSPLTESKMDFGVVGGVTLLSGGVGALIGSGNAKTTENYFIGTQREMYWTLMPLLSRHLYQRE